MIQLLMLMLIVAATPLFAVAPVDASDRSLLPPPIASNELGRLAAQLALSDAQLQAWRRAHLDYQHDHRTWRDHFIDQLAPLHSNIGRPPFDVADPADVRLFHATFRRAMDQLHQLDRQLFELAAPNLTDEQHERLPVVIAQRQRDAWLATRPIQRWFRGNFAPAHGTDGVDLYAVLDEAEIDSEQRRKLKTIIDHRIRQAPALFENLHRESGQLHERWAREVWNATEGDASLSRRSRAEPYVDLSDRALGAFERLLRFEHETLQAIFDTVQPDDAWRIYRVIVEHQRRPTRQRGIVQRFNALTADLRHAEIKTLTQNELNEVIAHARSILLSAFLDESERSIELVTVRPPGIGASASDIRAMTRVSMKNDPMLHFHETLKRLHAHVDEELAGAIDRLIVQRRIGDDAPPPEVIGRRQAERHRDDLSPDQHVPGPLSRRIVEAFAEATGLEADQRGILTMLHADYERAFMRIRHDMVDDVVSVYIGWSSALGASRRMRFSSVKDVRAKHEARLRAREAIDRLDRRFIDDVTIAVLPREAHSYRWVLEMLRAGEGWMRGENRGFLFIGDDAPFRTCLLDAILSADLDDQTVFAALDVYEPHAPVMHELIRSMWQLEMAAAFHRDLRTAAMRDNDQELSQESIRRMREDARSLRRVRQEIISRSFAILDELEAELSTAAAGPVLAAFRRAAYPSVFDDDDAEHDRFRASLTLDSLSQSQRDRLMEAWLSYQHNYSALTDEMTEIKRAATHGGINLGGDHRAEIDDIDRRIRELRNERQRHNDEAALAIETILTGSQLDRVGGDPR